MSRAAADRLAQTLLYEGYVLFPYRASSLKNQRRWTFGALAPQGGSERSRLVSELLVEGDGDTTVVATARFLHVLDRQVGHQHADGSVTFASELRAGGRVIGPWQEAVERVVGLPPLTLAVFAREQRLPFAFDSSVAIEVLRSGSPPSAAGGGAGGGGPSAAGGGAGGGGPSAAGGGAGGGGPSAAGGGAGGGRPSAAGGGAGGGGESRESGPRGAGTPVVVRTHAAIAGALVLSATPVSDGAWRLTVRLDNVSEGGEGARTLEAAHVLIQVNNGALVSATDPPPHLAAHALQQDGVWPVLVGAPGSRDVALCSPIIVDDYAAVAPESPGDHFDCCENDEMLTLSILALSDDERQQMADLDPRTRALLERSEGLGEQLGALHGAIRAFDGRERSVAMGVAVGGVVVGRGDQVRLRPRARADVYDIALAGKVATIQSVELDAEERVHVTVTVDCDPGRDLGVQGHRFFFFPDELEPFVPARVVVAGIGNVLLGDDGFGVAVARSLMGAAASADGEPWPDDVRVLDIGTRGMDLAFALVDADAAVLVDTAARGLAPGSVSVIAPDTSALAPAGADPHGMTPDRVLAFLRGTEAPAVVLLVTCEPASFGDEGVGHIGLSAAVAAAVSDAAATVRRLVGELRRGEHARPPPPPPPPAAEGGEPTGADHA